MKNTEKGLNMHLTCSNWIVNIHDRMSFCPRKLSGFQEKFTIYWKWPIFCKQTKQGWCTWTSLQPQNYRSRWIITLKRKQTYNLFPTFIQKKCFFTIYNSLFTPNFVV